MKTEKLCRRCGTVKPISEFYTSNGKKNDGFQGRCKECQKVANREWIAKNRDHVNARSTKYVTETRPGYAAESMRKARRKLRLGVLMAYSPGGVPKCACCGEDKMGFLVIDHIEGGGGKQKRDDGFSGGSCLPRWIRANGYPPGFRILCHNCNMARGLYGRCPHEDPTAGVIDER